MTELEGFIKTAVKAKDFCVFEAYSS